MSLVYHGACKAAYKLKKILCLYLLPFCRNTDIVSVCLMCRNFYVASGHQTNSGCQTCMRLLPSSERAPFQILIDTQIILNINNRKSSSCCVQAEGEVGIVSPASWGCDSVLPCLQLKTKWVLILLNNVSIGINLLLKWRHCWFSFCFPTVEICCCIFMSVEVP